MNSGLAIIDWIIIVLYAGGAIFLGWWFGRRQTSTREYFIGSGNMNPILIGVSLFASLLSTITYLSIPGELQGKGPVYLCNLIAYPFIFLIVGFVLLPVYMRQQVTSAYELLEKRLGISIRILGASMFLALRLVWMSLLIHLTATAISVMIFGGNMTAIHFALPPEPSGGSSVTGVFNEETGDHTPAGFTDDGREIGIRKILVDRDSKAISLEFEENIRGSLIAGYFDDYLLRISPVAQDPESPSPTFKYLFSRSDKSKDGKTLTWNVSDPNAVGALASATSWKVTIAESANRYIPLIVLITGIVALIYTSLGGLRAVVITDLMQTILLYGGAVLVIATVTWQMGGFAWFPTERAATWDTQPIFSFDPATRVTVFGTILSVLIWYVCTSGGDQVSIQRFMSTKDARSARRAIGMQLTVGAIVTVTLGLAGFAMLGYFQANPDLLPSELTGKSNADKIFPHFIAFHLPPVVSGLVVAGLFAAAMSSIDSGVNSITAVVTSDYIDRFRHKPISEKRHVQVARVIAFTVGGIVVVGSTFMDHVPGNITGVTNKTVNLLTVPIFCLFFFALFVRFASPIGVWVGAICGMTVAILVAFSGPIFGFLPDGRDPVSFQWIGPSALVVNLVTGCLASLVFPNKNKSILLAEEEPPESS